MILTCPQCKARFLVPDSAIGASGRAVRCGKCAHTWFCSSPKPAPEIPHTATAHAAPKETAPDIDKLMREGRVLVTPAATETPKLKPLPHGSGLPALRPAWRIKAAMAAVALTVLAAIAGLADFAPRLIGIPDSRELSFANVHIKDTGKAPDNKLERYALEGFIVNKGEEPRGHLLVRLALVDKDGHTLKRWWLRQHEGDVKAGGRVQFAMPELDIPKGNGLHFRLDMGNWLELALRPMDDNTH